MNYTFASVILLLLFYGACHREVQQQHGSKIDKHDAVSEIVTLIENGDLSISDDYRNRFMKSFSLDSTNYRNTTINFVYPFIIRAKLTSVNGEDLDSDSRRNLFDQLRNKSIEDIKPLLLVVFSEIELKQILEVTHQEGSFWAIEFSTLDGLGSQSALYMSSDSI